MDARLVAVRPYLVDVGAPGTDSEEPGGLLSKLVHAAAASGSPEQLWLLLVAISGSFPTAEEFRSARRALALSSPSTRVADLLGTLQAAAARAVPGTGLRVVSGITVVDAHFSATSGHNTGIQRVTRALAAEWAQRDDVLLVAWNERDAGYRALTHREHLRLTRWNAPVGDSAPTSPEQTDAAEGPVLVAPFGCTLVLPEVAHAAAIEPLAALAEYSGNSVVVIGHDTIPVASADTQMNQEIERFARFLAVVKHSRRVIGVSRSAAEEFRGFVSALASQGIAGPSVDAVPLGTEAPVAAENQPPEAAPLVLAVGSQEPRKNHFAILAAAERVAAEGHPFTLRFVGGGSALLTRRFDAEVSRLRTKGLRIEVLRKADDAQLTASYTRARFTCFPSLHEGFGLPVAESLALGVPCLTSRFGSTGAIAEEGGCVVVDPRDDDELTHAFRELLTDDNLITQLRQEIALRRPRGWDAYAAEVWTSAHEAPVEPLPGPMRSDTTDPGEANRSAAALRSFSRSIQLVAEREARPAARVSRALDRPRSLARLFVSQTREQGLSAASAAAAAKMRRMLRRTG